MSERAPTTGPGSSASITAAPASGTGPGSSIKLGRHMMAAVFGPVIALILLGSILAWQINRLVESANWVSHTDAVIAKLFETRLRVVERETALRAYLLSGDRAALAPFDRDPPDVVIDELIGLVRDNEVQLRRLRDAETGIDAWIKLTAAVMTGDVAVLRADLDALRARSDAMHYVRDLLDQATRHEQDLLRQRSLENADTERTAQIAFIGLLALSALIIAFVSRRQLVVVSGAFQGLVGDERAARQAAAHEEWIRRGEAQIAAALVGELSVPEVATRAIEAMCAHTGAVLGAMYQQRGSELHRLGGHALPANLPASVPLDSGQLGLVARDRRLRRVENAAVQLALQGGIGEARTVELVIASAALENRTVAVVELGFIARTDARVDELFEGVSRSIALALRSAEQRTRLQELLEETQRQGEELQTQHEELRVTNEELEHQSTALREAHVRQEQVQHELEATNANLEEQTALLEQQREELLRTQRSLEERARELQQASQYKSEFLARMSHELRTPLNSTLILARLLADNPGNNLTDEQVQFANTIYSAGNDLLLLINDILDLAKIEAGRLELRIGTVSLPRVRDTLQREFEPVARTKGLSFRVELDDKLSSVRSDEQRLVQVLRNLISNACKFTERGEVAIAIEQDAGVLSFAVRDTGIGIPVEHQERVFEAFHQVDGSVSRRHGGTGLGLAISRDLAQLLGGTLDVTSEPGRGTTFTLRIPVEPPTDARSAQPSSTRSTAVAEARRRPAPAAVVPPPAAKTPPVPAPPAAATAGGGLQPADDRDRLDPTRRKLLVIEDDTAFAGILTRLARELGFQALHAATADEGVALALRHVPDGILCDVNLPDHSGLSVLERLKRQPAIRHVPIHMISVEDHAQRSLELGAVGYLTKPASRDELVAAIQRIEDRTSQRVRRLLIVEDDPVQANALSLLLGGSNIEIATVGTVRDALHLLGTVTFDCVVMDLRLTDGTGFELLEKMAADERITFPPVIVHTGKALTEGEETQLRQYSSSIIVKGVRSPERLFDEVTLFLHQVESDLPPERQRMLREVRDREAVFDGRRVLVVEDDVRNVFALSSLLEPRGLAVVIARNGREALEVLDREQVDLVLMDIMMPEMDGLEATRRIRKRPDGVKLPIIALTAKAMADDRQACLDAGANDYLAKPIKVDMLLSLLRVWMPR